MQKSLPLSAHEGGRGKQMGFAAVLLIIAVISATLLNGIFSSDDTYSGAYQKLNEKRNNVIALTTVATGVSVAITTIGPDDAGTPVAEQLMVIARNFALVLAAIVLEKYLLGIMGTAFFGVIVPLCCVIAAATGFMKPTNPNRQVYRQAAIKLFALGLVLFLTTPASVYIASRIDETYQESIDATVEQGSEITAASNSNADASSEGDSSAVEGESRGTGKSDDKEAANPFEFLTNFGDDVAKNVSSAVEGATSVVAGAIAAAQNMVGNLIELFGVMLATSILIPILSPLVMYLAFKALFGQQLSAAPQQVVLLPAQSDNSIVSLRASEPEEVDAEKSDDSSEG